MIARGQARSQSTARRRTDAFWRFWISRRRATPAGRVRCWRCRCKMLTFNISARAQHRSRRGRLRDPTPSLSLTARPFPIGCGDGKRECLTLLPLPLMQTNTKAPAVLVDELVAVSASQDICEVGTANCSYACVLRRTSGALCSDKGRFNRAPGPALCSSIISTPAFSKALRTEAAFANVMAVSPSTASARWIVERLTPDSRARSEADHRSRARAALICAPRIVFMATRHPLDIFSFS